MERRQWEETLALHGPPPARLADGSYPALLRSIESGAVRSIRLEERAQPTVAAPARPG